MELAQRLATEFNLTRTHADNVISLIDSGNTVPFIARYRKEQTGSCDDQVLHALAARLETLRGLERRKGEVAAAIDGQNGFSEEVRRALEAASTLSEVEDLYRPFRPKRRTRASIAEEKGLGALADLLMAQDMRSGTLAEAASHFVDPDRGVLSWEEAAAGARDILAERMSDHPGLRGRLRRILFQNGVLVTEPGKKPDPVYETYHAYAEPVARIPGHRVLAIDRGERAEALRVGIRLEDDAPMAEICAQFLKPGSLFSASVRAAASDAWPRLIRPSIEREVRNALSDKAAEQAIAVFARNLRPLLLQPPVKGKVVLGLDPAYRTGCKAAVVDPTGKLLDTAVLYPVAPWNRTGEAKEKLGRLIRMHGVEAIAIGNGTASRETEAFVADLIRETGGTPGYAVVSEAGASVYSASRNAAEEFPDLDVTLRGAVSIARRLQDPLSELVKIEPRSIGVGQYQHDMPAARLDQALENVVSDCVNAVGVDLNTASAELLNHVSGLNASVSRNLVEYRNAAGGFSCREELKKVPRLGPKAYEQCAGFLRIPRGGNLLDNTAVHPESYDSARRLLSILGLSLEDPDGRLRSDVRSRTEAYGEREAAEACGIGIPTLRDIIAELERPGRDIRDDLPPPLLRTEALELKDLAPGMRMTGTVRNVIDFGVFVDIGVHQDGLVHVSEIADRYIRHPADAVRVGDVVSVTVLGVDPAKGRISLSMKRAQEP